MEFIYLFDVTQLLIYLIKVIECVSFRGIFNNVSDLKLDSVKYLIQLSPQQNIKGIPELLVRNIRWSRQRRRLVV